MFLDGLSVGQRSLISRAIQRNGRPIPAKIRAQLSRFFDRDFGNVRLHTGPSAARAARALNARAFAIGEHIGFAAGEFQLQSASGALLLAHELAHICQQGNSDGRSLEGELEPDCERAAESLASMFLHGLRADPGLMKLTAPHGSVQLHPGHPPGDAPCPGPPEWIDITSLRPMELWLPANMAIEAAYLADPRFKGHAILLGSQFNVGPGKEIRMPAGTPNRKLADQFLAQFKGIVNQLAPDIIDFTDRAFYEFKTRGFIAQGIAQLASYYRLINQIRISIGVVEGGPEWQPSNSYWIPPHSLPFPSDVRNKLVCTELTDYTIPSRQGLVIYGVKRRVTDEERKRIRMFAAAAAAIVEIAADFAAMAEAMQAVVRRQLKEANPEQEFRIVASNSFYETIVELARKAAMARTLQQLQVQGFDLRNPVLQLRSFGWSIVGLAEGTHAVIGITLYAAASLPLILGVGAVGGAGAAGAGGASAATGLTAAEIAQILGGGKAANDVLQPAVAAAVLLYVAGKTSTAQASQWKDVSTVQLVPVEKVEPPGNFADGRNVTVNGQPFREIARVQAGDGLGALQNP
ncbi:hypothetical protein Pan44_45370 [Caulifigura coniformis]|uniref:eCIS core domain-containing protein n=1 Tax=Caulifigura coniformis TaxID=2527983 RepID=A0A517SK30_9PLAN|nr:DUF4157 domain-containing protein [Caulifigura coniformis]QDT56483.1 hypothetical protein Pan44_45370 [Caulifigura coniformis]